MKKLVILTGLLCAGCGASSSPVAPLPVTPPVAACQANSTASVMFGNKSTDAHFDVFWDGARVVNDLGPGQNSQTLTVAAGVSHTLEFRFVGSSTMACQAANPIPAICGIPLYTCTY